ncbi:FBP domain-containing protein [Brevibacterium samyangense]
MQELTLTQLQKSFVNASRREAGLIKPPFDPDTFDWESHDFVGWADAKIPQRSYVFVPVDGEVRGVILRAVPPSRSHRSAVCAWCEDVIAVQGIRMFTAKRAGDAGRRGNTVGTLVHELFDCSAHARREPTGWEGRDDPEAFVAKRVEKLRANAEGFVRRVMDGK